MGWHDTAASGELTVERDAPISTWFGIGGRADRLARPGSAEDVRRCLELDGQARPLGDGANLLVDDDGVGDLVIAMTHPHMQAVTWGDEGRVVAMAGANLPKLITEAVRRGLGGIEGLAGIPATIGGAAMMNAGGAFGQIGTAIVRVHGVTRGARAITLERCNVPFEYRNSGLQGMVITAVEFRLTPGDKDALRERLKEVMAYKARSQPMAARSAGCCFKNPTVPRERALREGWIKPDAPQGDVEPSKARVSAGMLIDRAGCKGMRVGGAEVSDWHANFFVTREGARARDVIDLMGQVRRRVLDRFGVTIEPEVVVWSRERVA